jgi:dipeptidyl aminopeptidase/acylaminoacyl peptidase
MIAQLLGGSPDQKPDLTRLASPLDLVTPDACPFIIVHGGKDPVVPIQQSIDFYHALQKAGVPVQFYTIPNAGHGANSPEAFGMVIAFFDKYLR